MAKNLLIVEDSPVSGEMLMEVFKQEGYSLTWVDSAEKALEKVNENKPDLVLIDTILPGMDGFHLCEKLRSIYNSDELKLIVMTGSIDAVDASRARKAGADEYSVKTADCEVLKTVVNNLCSKE